MPVGHDSIFVDMAVLRLVRITCSRSPCFRGLGPTLDQRKYLPNCETKGFLRSKLSHRDLNWSVKKGTTKPSWICLLPLYQGSLVAMIRHVDWSTCFTDYWGRNILIPQGKNCSIDDLNRRFLFCPVLCTIWYFLESASLQLYNRPTSWFEVFFSFSWSMPVRPRLPVLFRVNVC